MDRRNIDIIRGALIGATIAIIVAVCFATAARAADCTTEPTVAATLRIAPPAPIANAPITGYRAKIGSAAGLYDRTVELATAPTADGSGRLTAELQGLDPAVPLHIAVLAYGPGGESPLSNEMVLGASKCLPPGRPTLDEIAAQLEAAADAIRAAAAALRSHE